MSSEPNELRTCYFSLRTMTTEQLKSEVESGNMDKLADYAKALAVQQAETVHRHLDRTTQLKFAITQAIYYLELGETGRATEILNQALSA